MTRSPIELFWTAKNCKIPIMLLLVEWMSENLKKWPACWIYKGRPDKLGMLLGSMGPFQKGDVCVISDIWSCPAGVRCWRKTTSFLTLVCCHPPPPSTSTACVTTRLTQLHSSQFYSVLIQMSFWSAGAVEMLINFAVFGDCLRRV